MLTLMQADLFRQSLTDNPDQAYPWESPPEFTDFRRAFDYLAEELLEEDVYVPLMVAMGQGAPLFQTFYSTFTKRISRR